MERLAKSFEADIQKAVGIAAKLPDDKSKMELIKVNHRKLIHGSSPSMHNQLTFIFSPRHSNS